MGVNRLFALAAAAGLSAIAGALWHRRASPAGRAAGDFRRRLSHALADPQLARNLLAFQRAWWPARAAAFGDSGLAFETLRDEMAAVKDAAIADLPRLVAQFRSAAEAAGAVVVEAGDAEAACAYVADLCVRRSARLVVKGKSMVGEEIELNPYLEARGLEVVETDLGEWIVQLARERPSHMVMPAIHKSRRQVGDLFSQALGRPVSREVIPEQVAVARDALRRKFLEADVGITGANALIAESGTVLLVTNEGNGRLVSTLPSVHVVLVGYEKLIASYADAVRQLRLLARSATAQPITSYTTFITGPDRPGKELHIVLVDNGRFAMRDDPELREALRCIRCGACANVCPPYQVVGGHVFGHIYTGAIGLVNTASHHGLEHAAGPQSLCVSCHACATVCPVAISLPRQILAVRARAGEAIGLPAWKRLALAIWARPRLADVFCRVAARACAPLADGGLLRRLPLPPAHRWRIPPAPALTPARDRLWATPARGVGDSATDPWGDSPPGGEESPRGDSALSRSSQGAPTVACFLQCVADRLCPDVAVATVRVLEACGARVAVPANQHCCGLPALDAGDLGTARRMARQTIAALEAAPADYVVSPGVSCIAAMRLEYPVLFAGDAAWESRARELAERAMDLATFLTRVAGVGEPRPPAGGSGAIPSPARDGAAVAYQPFCQGVNALGLPAEPRGLLEEGLGVALRPLPEAHVCCGFGGFTSLDHPAVAQPIAARKLANVADAGAEVLVTDNPGCLLHLRGAVAAAGRDLEVIHLAELAAERLPADRPLEARSRHAGGDRPARPGATC